MMRFYLVFWEGKSGLILLSTLDVSIDVVVFSTICMVVIWIVDTCMMEGW